MNRPKVAGVAWLFLCAIAAPSRAQPFEVTRLTLMDGDSFYYAEALNDVGQVAGVRESYEEEMPVYDLFLWSAADGVKDIELSEPAAGWSVRVLDLNNAGQILFAYQRPGTYEDVAAIWDETNGFVKIADNGPGSFHAGDMNDLGQVVLGWCGEVNDGFSAALLWDDEQGLRDAWSAISGKLGPSEMPREPLWTSGGAAIRLLQYIGAEPPPEPPPENEREASDAVAINDAGQILLSEVICSEERWYLWDPKDGLTEVLHGGMGWMWPHDLNNLGQVVGTLAVGEEYHSFLWDASTGLTDLGTPANARLHPGWSDHKHYISDMGQVVTTVSTLEGDVLVYWDSILGWAFLESLVLPGSGNELEPGTLYDVRGLTARGEILAPCDWGWYLLSPVDPVRDVYVSNAGSDVTGNGSEENPYASIDLGMRVVSIAATAEDRGVVHLAPGIYDEPVVFRPHVTIQGADPGNPGVTIIQHFEETDGEHVVVRAAEDTAIRDCEISFPGLYTSNVALLHIDNVSIEVSNVVFDGLYNQQSTAVLVYGPASSASVISDCTFIQLRDGIWAVDSRVNVTRNLFDSILNDAVFVKVPDTKNGPSYLTPLLGQSIDAAGTGFNRFRAVEGMFIRNVTPNETLAEYNDWGVYTEGEISGKTAGAGGVDFEPWIGKAVVRGSIAVEVLDDATQEHIADSANPQVTLGGLGEDRDAASSLFLFADLQPGTYTVSGAADGYTPDWELYSLRAGEIAAVTVELSVLGAEGEGEGAQGCLGGITTSGDARGPAPGGDMALLAIAAVALLTLSGKRGREFLSQ